MNGADLLIECLKAQEVDSVFGMPGVQNLKIYDALYREGGKSLNHYLVRHEYAATLMALGCSRATGRVGVALTVPGPGATNAATGILEAYTDCDPVLLITGQGPSSLYKKDPSKLFHGLDQMSLFKPITKYCAIAHTPEEIPEVVKKAFQALRSGRPGPVVLEFPDDVLTAETDAPVTPFVERIPGPDPDPEDLNKVVQTLAQAKRPMIIAGSAVVHAKAREELRELAEKLNIPVAVTRGSKGVLPEDHPLALNHCCRYVGDQAMKAADCTLAIGYRFAQLDTRNYTMEPPRPLIQIDEDPREIGLEYPCEVGLVGDLKATLRALIQAVEPKQTDWPQLVHGFKDKFAAQPPLPVLPDIREVLPEDGILCVDCHTIGYASHDEFPVNDPSNYYFPNVTVALGSAFPVALGAKAAQPGRAVICFTGDGGYLMGSPEMSTAVKYGINVVTVVVNDQTLSGIMGSQQKFYDGRIIDVEMLNPDFVKFAESFGAWSRRVEDFSEFKAVLQEAMAQDRPSLIEIMVGDQQQDLIDGIEWLRPELLRK